MKQIFCEDKSTDKNIGNTDKRKIIEVVNLACDRNDIAYDDRKTY